MLGVACGHIESNLQSRVTDSHGELKHASLNHASKRAACDISHTNDELRVDIKRLFAELVIDSDDLYLFPKEFCYVA